MRLALKSFLLGHPTAVAAGTERRALQLLGAVPALAGVEMIIEGDLQLLHRGLAAPADERGALQLSRPGAISQVEGGIARDLQLVDGLGLFRFHPGPFAHHAAQFLFVELSQLRELWRERPLLELLDGPLDFAKLLFKELEVLLRVRRPWISAGIQEFVLCHEG
jgi:hypothetical protein